MTQIQSRPSLDQIFGNIAPTQNRPSLDQIFGADYASQANSPDVIAQNNQRIESQLASQPTQQTMMQNLGSGIIQGGKNVVMGGLQAGTDVLAKAFPQNQTIQDFRSLLPEAQASSNIAYQAATGNSKAAALGRLGMEGASYGLLGDPIVGGIIAGAIQPSEKQQSPDNALMERAKGGAIGGAIGAIAPVVANKITDGVNTIIQGIKSSSPEALDAIESGMKQVSSGLYKNMKDMGAELTPEAQQNIVQNVKDALNDEIGELDPELYKTTNSLLNGLQKSADNGTLDLNALDKKARSFSRISSINSEDKFAGGLAKNTIDNAVNNLTNDDLTNGSTEAVDALNAARAQWSQAKKFELVSNIIKDAQGDTSKLKNGLNNLLKSRNGAKIAGFSDDELDALKNAASSSTPEYILKGLGAFGFNPAKHPFMAMSEIGALGATHANPVVGGTIAAGTVANQLGKYMARGKAEQLIQVLQSGGIPNEIGQLPPQVAAQLLQTYRRGQ